MSSKQYVLGTFSTLFASGSFTSTRASEVTLKNMGISITYMQPMNIDTTKVNKI